MHYEHDGKEVTAAILKGGARIKTKGVDVVLAIGAWTIDTKLPLWSLRGTGDHSVVSS